MTTKVSTALEALVETTKGTNLDGLASATYVAWETLVSAGHRLRGDLKTIGENVTAYEEARRTMALDRMAERRQLWCRDCKMLKAREGFNYLFISRVQAAKDPAEETSAPSTPKLCLVCHECFTTFRNLSADHTEELVALVARRISGDVPSNLQVRRGDSWYGVTEEFDDNADLLPSPIPKKLATALELPPEIRFTNNIPDAFATLFITSADHTTGLEV